MSDPSSRPALPPVPGFAPARSYAEWEQQKRAHSVRLAAERHGAKPPSMMQQKGMGMAMGFGMGMFVGGSVTVLHTVMSKMPLDRMAIKRAVGGGTAFGVIFAVGSLVR